MKNTHMMFTPETEAKQAPAPLAETYMLIVPGLALDEYDRERWIVAKRGGTIFDDIALEYPSQRGFAAFDGPAVEWVFRRSDLILIDPDRDHAYGVWNQQLAAGRKIALVATHFDRCADWYRHAVRWRGPNTFVYGWLPSAGTEQ
jgi:hypothetical protein